MTLFASSPAWLLWLLVCLITAAAIQDARDLKISNVISVGVAVGAFVAMIVAGLDVRLWQNFLAFALILSLGTLAFSRGILGGGDVKLFAALGLWTDLGTALRMTVAILLCGGVLALGVILIRLVAPAAIEKQWKTLRRGSGIPYGVAIAAGSLLVITLSRMQL